MPKMNNLTRRKERRSRKNDGCLFFRRESPLASSASLFVTPRKVSNEDMHETSHHYNIVTPPTSLTKFNEDGTYRMEAASSPRQRRSQQSPRLLRSFSSTSSSDTSASTSSETRRIKRSTGSLKRCLVDLTDLVTEDASHVSPDPTEECTSEDPMQVRELVSPSADSSNWGHFIDEIPVDQHRPAFLHFPKPQKRRRIIKSRHDKPLKGFLLASVDETAKELDGLRF